MSSALQELESHRNSKYLKTELTWKSSRLIPSLSAQFFFSTSVMKGFCLYNEKTAEVGLGVAVVSAIAIFVAREGVFVDAARFVERLRGGGEGKKREVQNQWLKVIFVTDSLYF